MAKYRLAGMRGLMILGGALALLCWPGPAVAQKVSFRLATEMGKGEDVYLLLDKFRELAEAKAKGRIEVKFFGGGILGTQRQLQEQVQLGTLDAIGTASDLPEMEPRFGVFDFPFLLRDRAHAYKVMDGPVGDELNQTLIKNKGVRVLAYGELGFRHVTNNSRPIVKPDDLRGLKIRVPSNRIRIAAFKALGGAPTPIPYKELYTSLQQKVVDGQENNLFPLKGLSLWEVQKYLSLTYHVFTPAYLLVNERWWQGLPADVQGVLREAAGEAQAWQRREMERMDREILDQAKARGMHVNDADTAAFSLATRPIWAEFSERVGKEMVDRVLATR